MTRAVRHPTRKVSEHLETFLASLDASLHANSQVPAHRRDQLEWLIRYPARGAVSLERLSEHESGDLVYTFLEAGELLLSEG